MLLKLLEHMNQPDHLDFPHKGTVVFNDDPLKLGRIKVLIEDLFPDLADLPALEDDETSVYDPLPWITAKFDTEQGGRTDASSFYVPEIGAEVNVVFPYGDIYSGFADGYWGSETTHAGFFDQSYPNSYGWNDPTGTRFRVDKLLKSVEFEHASGMSARVDKDGNVVLSSKGTVTFQSPNGDISFKFDPVSGQVTVDSPDKQRITADLEIDNTKITETTGSKIQDISGDKVIDVGGGYRRSVAGSESAHVIGSSSLAVGDNKTMMVGGFTEETHGLGFSSCVVAGDWEADALLGSVRLSSLLATLRLPISGIAELDGIMVHIAGGDQPMLLGLDSVKWMQIHKHPTGVGLSGVADNAAAALDLLSLKGFNG